MDLYRQLILDHYKHPQNYGLMETPDATGEAYNATCGDKIRMDISVHANRSVYSVRDIRFSGEGCAISIASASLLTEEVKGKIFDEILAFTTADITKMLGATLTPSRVKCAVLPLEVLHQAINSYAHHS
ncbi:MAG: iron-sulfur cluster assembly scaffold protein [bacterium]|nr:iron-sulfur cluster assembly scaffold protein [bacterium]